MNRKLTLGIAAAGLVLGSVVTALPATAATSDCTTGSICFYNDDDLLAQIKPGQRVPLGTSFDEIHNASRYTLNFSYDGWTEDEFGYVFSTMGSDRVSAGAEWNFNGGVYASRLTYTR